MLFLIIACTSSFLLRCPGKAFASRLWSFLSSHDSHKCLVKMCQAWFQGGSLLQFFFLCALVISYVAFVLSLFVPHLSFYRYLVKVMLRDRAFPGYRHL